MILFVSNKGTALFDSCTNIIILSPTTPLLNFSNVLVFCYVIAYKIDRYQLLLFWVSPRWCQLRLLGAMVANKSLSLVPLMGTVFPYFLHLNFLMNYCIKFVSLLLLYIFCNLFFIVWSAPKSVFKVELRIHVICPMNWPRMDPRYKFTF